MRFSSRPTPICFGMVLAPEVGRLEIRSLIKTKVPKIEFHRYPARTDAHFGRLFARNAGVP